MYLEARNFILGPGEVVELGRVRRLLVSVPAGDRVRLGLGKVNLDAEWSFALDSDASPLRVEELDGAPAWLHNPRGAVDVVEVSVILWR